MAEESKDKDLAPRQDPPPVAQSNAIRLGPREEIDLTGLSPQAREGLKVKHGEMMLERDNRRERLKEDLAVTATKLSQYGQAAAQATDANIAVTITNTNDDALGRTEIMIGNTDAARKGKLTRSQTGVGDNAGPWIIVAIIVGIVVVLVAVFRR